MNITMGSPNPACFSPQMNAFLRPQTLTPPQSRQTTPVLAPSPMTVFSEPGLRRTTFVSQSPDLPCTRKYQPLQSRRKNYPARQLDSTCPYPIPQRTSSLYQAHNTSKVIKPTTQYIRQQQLTRARRSPSASSISSMSSLGSTVNSPYLQAALASQAQIVSGPVRHSNSGSISMINTNNGFSCSTSEVAFIPDNMMQQLDDCSPTELFPVLPSSSSTSPSSTLSTNSMYSSPSLSASTASYNTSPNISPDTSPNAKEIYNYSLPDDFYALPALAPITDAELEIPSSVHPSTESTVDSDVHEGTATAVKLAMAGSAIPTMTPRIIDVSPSLVDSEFDFTVTDADLDLGFGLGLDIPTTVDIDAMAKTLNDTPVPTYSSNFVPANVGGAGVLLDTSRLRGRVLRPWN